MATFLLYLFWLAVLLDAPMCKQLAHVRPAALFIISRPDDAVTSSSCHRAFSAVHTEALSLSLCAS